MSKWSNEDIQLFKKFKSIVKRGYYCDGKQLTDLYNKVFNQSLRPTSCATCLKIRFNELKKDYEKLTAELNNQDNGKETDTQAKADS